MSDLLVRNVPEAVVDDLKRRAAGNRRSLQAEILTILEEAVEEGRRRERFFETADEFRTKLAQTGRQFSDSIDLIREDRQR